LSNTSPQSDFYDRSDVVASYVAADTLQGAETFLFEKYIQQGSVILDLGVGAGRTTPFLAKYAKRYVGLDYASAMVDACRSRFPDLEFHCGDAADLSMFETASFDVVVFSYNGMGHLSHEGRAQCLAHIHRILKPSGYFIFSLHNARGLLLRPSRNGAGLLATVSGLARSAVANIRRMTQRLTSPTYWRGQGNLWLSLHGGRSLLFLSTPPATCQELDRNGFDLLDTLPNTYPVATNAVFFRLWYHAARRRA